MARIAQTVTLSPAAIKFVPKGETKMEKCRHIMTKYQHKGRPFVLAMFKAHTGLTDKGASTYFQTLKNAAQ